VKEAIWTSPAFVNAGKFAASNTCRDGCLQEIVSPLASANEQPRSFLLLGHKLSVRICVTTVLSIAEINQAHSQVYFCF
jgi:hypothetical protein